MWAVTWMPRAIDDLERLDRNLQRRINAAVERLAQTGHGDVKRLQGLEEYRLRVGQWRVRFTRNDVSHTMSILRVRPRGSAYR